MYDSISQFSEQAVDDMNLYCFCSDLELCCWSESGGRNEKIYTDAILCQNSRFDERSHGVVGVNETPSTQSYLYSICDLFSSCGHHAVLDRKPGARDS